MLEAEIDIERGKTPEPRGKRVPKLTLSNPSGFNPISGSSASGQWSQDLVSRISDAVGTEVGTGHDNGIAEDIGEEILAAIEIGNSSQGSDRQ